MQTTNTPSLPRTLSLNFQRYLYLLFPSWEESRGRQRQSLATICDAALRKRTSVWRRGQEFERLI